MARNRWFHGRSAARALGLLALLGLSACTTTPTGMAAFFCTASIGDLPVFTLVGSEDPFTATRPGAGGVTQVAIAIVVEEGGFDFVLWDVLDLIAYNPPPDSMEFIIENDDPDTGWPGAGDTSLVIHVYAWTPPGDYGLKVRGLAYTGDFASGDGDLVGECFRTFVLSVL